MPWVLTTDAPIFCGGCATLMEKYAISRCLDDLVFLAERCVTCRTQFNYLPTPDQVPFGSTPGTGSIKWEVKHDKKNKTNRRPRRTRSKVLGRNGNRTSRGHR